MSQDLNTLLAQARLPERTVALCLRGDLQAQYEKLERQLAEAEQKPGDKLTDQGPRAIAQQIEQLRDQMRGSTVMVTLRALPRREWTELVAKHPPKDQSMMWDPDTFGPDLVRRSIVDPALSEDQWTKLDAKLTDAQFGELGSTALDLNRRPVDVPFSHAASRTLRISEQK